MLKCLPDLRTVVINNGPPTVIFGSQENTTEVYLVISSPSLAARFDIEVVSIYLSSDHLPISTKYVGHSPPQSTTLNIMSVYK